MPFLNFEQKNTSCKRKSNLLTLKLSKRHNGLIILRKENKMTENVIPMSESIEDFMASFGITRLETQKDEGLLSKASCRQRILDAIKFNIQTFKDNAWTKENQMLKLLVDLDEKKNSAIFNVRLGGKRIYRCSCPLMSLDEKIEFLTKFYEAISKGVLFSSLADFSILSSPSSASDTRCPTSVIFITCFKLYPLYFKTLLKLSINKYNIYLKQDKY